MKKLLASILLFSSTFVNAQQTTSTPIEIVITQGPGSGLSAIYLQLEKYAASRDVKLIPTYKPGASGIVGITYAANKNVLVLTIDTDYNNAKGHCKPECNFNFVSTVGQPDLILVASNKSKLATINDVIETEKNSPGKLNWAQLNSLSQAFIDSYASNFSLDDQKITRVLYNKSSTNDLLIGDVDLAFLTLPVANQYTKNNLIKIIEIDEHTRNKISPKTNKVVIYSSGNATNQNLGEKFIKEFLNDPGVINYFNSVGLKRS